MNRRSEEKFFLEKFVVGPMAENCYLVADPAIKDACLIDPGADPHLMQRAIARNGFNLKFIINTHGHGDHIAANGHFNVPIYIHRLDKDFLTDTEKNMSRFFMFGIKSPKASRLLEDGNSIGLGALEFEVIHTPGHTPGSISLKLDDAVFTGDTLFQSGVGRTDFPYGDEEALFNSITKRLFLLPDGTAIYPGHGESSTIGEEKRSNPFL